MIRNYSSLVMAVFFMIQGVLMYAADNSVAVPDITPKTGTVYLDGKSSDSIWARAHTLPAFASRKGVTSRPSAQSRIQVVKAGQYLLFGITAGEDRGIIARESFNGTPMWYDDAVTLRLSSGTQRMDVMINPLGCIYARSSKANTHKLIARKTVTAAATIHDHAWRVEAAVDITEIIGDAEFPCTIQCRITRQRQARGIRTPYEERFVPSEDSSLSLVLQQPPHGIGVDVQSAPPQRFTGKNILEAAEFDDTPDWKRAPAERLVPANGLPPLKNYFQPTIVRAAVCGETLFFSVQCSEDFPQTMQATGKSIWREDNLEIFLGPEKFAYLQLLISPCGRVSAARAKAGGKRGARGIRKPEGVVCKVKKGKSAWTADITIPIGAVLRTAGVTGAYAPDVYPWVIQMTRNRPARKKLGQVTQLSVLSVTNSHTSHCPLRFAGLRIIRASETAVAAPLFPVPVLPEPVLTNKEREALSPSTALKRWVDQRKSAINQEMSAKIKAVQSAAEWTELASSIRKKMRSNMFQARGGKLPEKTPLRAENVYEINSQGVRIKGGVFQSRPGLAVPATLYEPAEKPSGKLPAMVVIPAQHTQRNSADVIIFCSTFARAGGIAISMESIGSGERLVSAAFRHKRQQRNLVATQLLLGGETLEGWTAWDISRGLDYLLDRGDVDPERVGILGGVAGGGDVVALAALIDQRFTLSIPFNFGSPNPFSGYCEPLRAYYGANAAGCSPWLTNASIAPRRLIQAHEFAWGESHQKNQDRYKRIYTLFDAAEHVTYLHGGPNTHALHFDVVQRRPMYKIINRFFDMTIMEDSNDECRPKVKSSHLECLQTPGGLNLVHKWSAKSMLREPHEVARKLFERRLNNQRGWTKTSPAAIRKSLNALFTDTTPSKTAKDKIIRKDTGTWNGFQTTGIWLPHASGVKGLGIALWHITPENADGKSPAVLCLAQPGKARFLHKRTSEIRQVLDAGIQVVLMDPRGFGESAASQSRLPHAETGLLASELWMMDQNLPLLQFRDVRAVLQYLGTQKTIDPKRIALWGEGFSSPNQVSTKKILFHETCYGQTNPVPKDLADATGGLLVLMAGLYPVDNDNSGIFPAFVLSRGTLSSFMSVVEDAHHYLPMDCVIPGLLTCTDTMDMYSAISDKAIVQDLRDAQNRSVHPKQLTAEWKDAAPADYTPYPTIDAVKKMIEALKK